MQLTRALTAIAFALILAACASGGDEADTQPTGAAPDETPTEVVVDVLGEFNQRPAESGFDRPDAFIDDWVEPAAAITIENVFSVVPLGQLEAPGNPSTMFDFAFSADGTEIAVLNNTLVLGYDLITGQLQFNNTRQEAVRAFFSPDKETVNLVSGVGEGFILETNTGDMTYRYQAHPAFSGAMAYAERSGWLAVGGQDGSFKVWDTFERESRVTVDAAHEGPVARLAFSSDGTQLASSGRDGQVVLWNWAERESLLMLQPAEAVISGLAFSPNGSILAVAGRERVTIWDSETGDLLHTLLVGDGGTSDVFKFSPDGRFLLTAGQIPDAILWDAVTGDLIALLPGVGLDRVSADFSVDGDLLLTSVLDGPVSLWDLNQIDRENRTIVRADIPVGSERIVNVAFSPDGFLMVFFDASGPAFVWGVPPTFDDGE